MAAGKAFSSALPRVPACGEGEHSCVTCNPSPSRGKMRRAKRPGSGGQAMHFVIHAVGRADALTPRAKFYRDHRIHLDQADRHGVAVTTAGTLVAPDGETPVGSLFILGAANRAPV